MSATNDGGQAFPTPSRCNPQGLVEYSDGMTMRDWFAGKAMQAVVGSMLREGTRTKYDIDNPEHLDCVAMDAYAMADAMLKARGGTP